MANDLHYVAQNLDIAVAKNLTRAGSIQNRLASAWLERLAHVFPLGERTIPAALAARLHALRDRMTTNGDVRSTTAAMSDADAEDVVDEIRELRDEVDSLLG